MLDIMINEVSLIQTSGDNSIVRSTDNLNERFNYSLFCHREPSINMCLNRQRTRINGLLSRPCVFCPTGAYERGIRVLIRS